MWDYQPVKVKLVTFLLNLNHEKYIPSYVNVLCKRDCSSDKWLVQYGIYNTLLYLEFAFFFKADLDSGNSFHLIVS